MLGLMMRSVQAAPCAHRPDLDHKAILSAYKAHVRSVVEYASVIWSGAAVTHLKRFERLQHRFLMWLGCKTQRRCPSMDYTSLLTLFKIQSTKARFIQTDLKFLQSVLCTYMAAWTVQIWFQCFSWLRLHDERGTLDCSMCRADG